MSKIINSEAWKNKNYQGWSNYYTWNVMLYFNNDYNLYHRVQEWKTYNKKSYCKRHTQESYINLIRFLGVAGIETLDGVKFADAHIVTSQIINAIFED